MPQPLLYVAGPARSAHGGQLVLESVVATLWKWGASVICPHDNAGWLAGCVSPSSLVRGNQTMLARCDAVVLTPNWSSHPAAVADRDYAASRGLCVFEWDQDREAIQRWVGERGS